MQIRKPEPTLTIEEIKKLREEAEKTPIESPKFDFSIPYEEIDMETLRKFARKCNYIEEEALKIISKKYDVNYSEILGAVYIDIEDEWKATEQQVSDEDWIAATVQSFEAELKAEEYI